MAVTTRTGRRKREVATRRRVVTGYSAGRQAYDRRRRRHPLDAIGRAYRDLVRHDICAYCGARADPTNDADHIQPLSDGGDNIWENLGAACASCNRSKGSKKTVLDMLIERANGDRHAA